VPGAASIAASTDGIRLPAIHRNPRMPKNMNSIERLVAEPTT
jgi:hypothetical protein